MRGKGRERVSPDRAASLMSDIKINEALSQKGKELEMAELFSF